MKNLNSIVAVGVVAAVSASASAALVVGWTMPTAFPTGAGVPTGISYVPPMLAGEPAGQANQGVNRAGSEIRSVHALPAATYTSPAGNGSQYSFSSNNWSIGDYYQVSFSAAGFSGLSVTWDQARSSTGPSSFSVLASTDGVNFTTVLASYTVLQSGGGGAPGTWSSTSYNSLYTSTQALGATFDNASTVTIRFQSTVSGASTGSSRIDDVMVNGTAIPAPGALALLGVAGLVGSRRRR
jgi:MYXO-CTERM domain-containing protein